MNSSGSSTNNLISSTYRLDIQNLPSCSSTTAPSMLIDFNISLSQKVQYINESTEIEVECTRNNNETPYNIDVNCYGTTKTVTCSGAFTGTLIVTCYCFIKFLCTSN